jgi:lysophospholipase L1-like esterase
VLCFGDSNTWGAVPVAGWHQIGRLAPDERWPGVLQERLGDEWIVIAEGLPSRTTILDDPVDGSHVNGLTYLRPCLLSHTPLDYIVLLLGTNDLKRRFNLVAEDVAVGIDRLLKEIRASDSVVGGLANVLVVCPPPLKVAGVFGVMFEGGDRKSETLSPYIAEIAASHGAGFLDAGEIVVSSEIDGIHLDASEHRKLGSAVAERILLSPATP